MTRGNERVEEWKEKSLRSYDLKEIPPGSMKRRSRRKRAKRSLEKLNLRLQNNYPRLKETFNDKFVRCAVKLAWPPTLTYQSSPPFCSLEATEAATLTQKRYPRLCSADWRAFHAKVESLGIPRRVSSSLEKPAKQRGPRTKINLPWPTKDNEFALASRSPHGTISETTVAFSITFTFFISSFSFLCRRTFPLVSAGFLEGKSSVPFAGRRKME